MSEQEVEKANDVTSLEMCENINKYEENMEKARDIVCQIYSLRGMWDIEKERYDELWNELKKLLKEILDEKEINLKEENKIMRETITDRELRMHHKEIEYCDIYSEELIKVLQELRYIKDDLVHYEYMNEMRYKVLDNIIYMVSVVDDMLHDKRMCHACAITEARLDGYNYII